MTWSDFYLICFLVGFSLSALALLAGSVHLHLPHLHMHHGVHLGGTGWRRVGCYAARRGDWHDARHPRQGAGQRRRPLGG